MGWINSKNCVKVGVIQLKCVLIVCMRTQRDHMIRYEMQMMHFDNIMNMDARFVLHKMAKSLH